VDTQGSGYVDPADQWVLDPVTGTYQLRLEPAQPPAADVPPQQPAPGHTAPGTAAPAPEPAAPQRREAPAAPPPGGRSAARRAARSGHGRRAAGGASSRRKPKQKRPRTLLWTAGAVGLAIVAGGMGGYLAFRHTSTVIHTVDVGDAGSTAVTGPGAANLLVLGTDSTAGLGREMGSAARTGSADTAVLLHLSADRSNATAISIPPNLVTDVPDCPVGNNVVKGASGQPFSAVLAGRDPGCAMRLVQQMTGLPVDHFLMVDYAAVKSLSTAVGGVELCLKQPLSDPRVHLDLKAGQQRVQGDQALALVRTLKAPPGHDDLARVAVQERFLSGLLRSATSGGLFGDPKKLMGLATTAAGALTVDSPIGSVQALDTLAGQIGKVPAKHFTFAELPVKNGPRSGTVVLDRTTAADLFAMVKADVSLSQGRKAPDPKLVGPKTTPHDTRVTVYNGTGTFGASQDVLAWLQNDEGVNRSANGGDAPQKAPRTILKYAPNQADQARSLAAMMHLPASALVEGTKDAPKLAYMSLTLGADYTSPGAPIGPPTAPPKGLRTLTADSTACVG
jgi:LCP family protein required for cell wall assembly